MAFSTAQQKIGRLLSQLEQRQEPALVPGLVRRLGYAAESSLTPTLRLMERDGWLIISGGGAKGRPRVVSLTARGRQTFGSGGLPLLGSIPAGPLSEAIADADAVLESAELLPYRDGDFLLRVRGDSMIGDGILDGDLVLLRPNVDPRPGEIAAVLVEDGPESTLKRVELRGAKLVLRAANPNYPDQIVSAESVKIAGVFRGLIRHESRAR